MKKRQIAPLLGVGFIIFLIFFVYRSAFFTVKSVKIKGDSAPCFSSSTVAVTGKNIVTLDIPKLQSEIIKKNPCLKKVGIDKKWPSAIELTLVARKEITKLVKFDRSLDLNLTEATPSSTTALLNWSFPSDPGRDYLLVDEEGVIFQQVESSNVPLLFLDSPQLQVGEHLSRQLFQQIQIIFMKVLELGITAPMAKLEGDDLLLNSQPKLVFRVETKENSPDQLKRSLASLQLILQKAKMDGREMNTIDLRFDKPVVTYLPSKKK